MDTFNEPEAMRILELILKEVASLSEYDRHRVIASVVAFYAKKPKDQND